MPQVELVQLPAATIAALAVRDLAAANASSPVPLTDWYAYDEESRHVWERRTGQLADHPGDADWITRVIWDPAAGLAVGQAGFHGPPDDVGMVEVGYAVMPAYRRRGYARAAFEALLRRARDEPGVRVLRAAISPGNLASQAVIAGFGMVEVGEQWDAEDGPETVYEVAV